MVEDASRCRCRKFHRPRQKRRGFSIVVLNLQLNRNIRPGLHRRPGQLSPGHHMDTDLQLETCRCPRHQDLLAASTSRSATSTATWCPRPSPASTAPARRECSCATCACAPRRGRPPQDASPPGRPENAAPMSSAVERKKPPQRHHLPWMTITMTIRPPSTTATMLNQPLPKASLQSRPGRDQVMTTASSLQELRA